MAMRAYIRVRVFLTRVPSPNIFPRTIPIRMLANALILEQNRNSRFYSKLIRNARKYRDMKIQSEKRWKQKYDRLEANVSAVFFSPFTLLNNLEGDGERRSRVLFSTKENKEWKVGRTVNSTIEPVRVRCHPRCKNVSAKEGEDGMVSESPGTFILLLKLSRAARSSFHDFKRTVSFVSI